MEDWIQHRINLAAAERARKLAAGQAPDLGHDDFDRIYGETREAACYHPPRSAIEPDAILAAIRAAGGSIDANGLAAALGITPTHANKGLRLMYDRRELTREKVVARGAIVHRYRPALARDMKDAG